jgi:hypothetical protein
LEIFELITIALFATPELNKGDIHLVPSSVLPHNGSYEVSPVVLDCVGMAHTPLDSPLSPVAFTAVTAAKIGAPLVSGDSVAPVVLTLVLVLAVVTGSVSELYTL